MDNDTGTESMVSHRRERARRRNREEGNRATRRTPLGPCGAPHVPACSQLLPPTSRGPRVEVLGPSAQDPGDPAPQQSHSHLASS